MTSASRLGSSLTVRDAHRASLDERAKQPRSCEVNQSTCLERTVVGRFLSSLLISTGTNVRVSFPQCTATLSSLSLRLMYSTYTTTYILLKTKICNIDSRCLYRTITHLPSAPTPVLLYRSNTPQRVQLKKALKQTLIAKFFKQF